MRTERESSGRAMAARAVLQRSAADSSLRAFEKEKNVLKGDKKLLILDNKVAD